MKLALAIVLCIAGVFGAGAVWWCEDCGGGGFGEHNDRRHRFGCRFRGYL